MTEDGQWKRLYTAMDDERICVQGGFLHDRVFEQGTEPALPLHPNCRCWYEHVPPDTEPTRVDWSRVAADIRRAFVQWVAWLLRNHAPIPPIFWPLIEEAKKYNREREDDGDSTMDPTMSLSRSRPTRLQSGRLTLAVDERDEYEVRFMAAGRIRAAGDRPGHLTFTPECIRDAIERGLFDGLPCFVDHPGAFQNAKLQDLAAVTLPETRWNPDTQSADGKVRLYGTTAGRLMSQLFSDMAADHEAGLPVPDIGLSVVLWPERWQMYDEPGRPTDVLEIRKIESADFVFQPAADGRIKQFLSALGAGRPAPQSGGDTMTDQTEPTADDRETYQPPATVTEWATALQRAAVPAILAASDLPAPSRARLAAGDYQGPADLERAIQQERAYLADLAEANVIQIGSIPPRGSQITLGRTALEQVEAAFIALLEGQRPPDGIRPLTGIRELYHVLSGDYEMHGIFHPDRVMLANVNSSTMAGLVANALNKRIVNEFQRYPRWWEPIVTQEDFSSLQDVRWITLGGVGELPTVAEGAAYTELTWDDQTETDSFVKKGGYLGITLEAIDKDDTSRLLVAPRALAQAAWLTLGKAVSAIFTSNSGVGPTLSDGVALFHAASHGNLLTTALSWTAYTAVRTAMRKQTELNSGERLGALTAPRYLLVPPDLEITALQILASEGEPGTADNDTNPLARGNEHDTRLDAARRRVIVVDLWTDTNDWAAVADPLMYPSIGLGFRYGRVPEVFSVASPTAGLMFTNDTFPIKVRFFFAVGPTDYRGLHKNNVS